jgi:hypothetical protein
MKCHALVVEGEVKFFALRATEACRRRRRIAPLILYLGIRCRWVVSFTIRSLYSRELNPGALSIGGWVAPRAHPAGLEDGKYIAAAGILTPDRPFRAQSLYQLGYAITIYVADSVGSNREDRALECAAVCPCLASSGTRDTLRHSVIFILACAST